MHAPERHIEGRLRRAGLRPTQRRVALAELLFADGHRHVTAEQLHREAREAGLSVSLATIYNTLNQFTDAGLLKQVVLGGNRTFYDTNTDEHHHFYREEDGELIDIPLRELKFASFPHLPEGQEIAGIDVIIRLAGKG